MWHTCKVCLFTHSCWCGGKKCRCWMNLWESKVASNIVMLYDIDDKELLISLIKSKNTLQSILDKFWIESTQTVAKNYEGNSVEVLDVNFAKGLWMKSVYCEYKSFNENAECVFCSRIRKEWYLKPCLYYISKKWTT